MTIQNYSPDFYKQEYVQAIASTTSTAAGDVNGNIIPVEGATGFNFITRATGGSALAVDKYLILKSIQFGNADMSANITTYLIDSGYILVKGQKVNVSTDLRLAAVGNFKAGIANFAINGQTAVRAVYTIVGTSPNIIWEGHCIKTIDTTPSS